MPEIHTSNYSFGFLQRAFAAYAQAGTLSNFHNNLENVIQSHDQFDLNVFAHIRFQNGQSNSSLSSNTLEVNQHYYMFSLEGHISMSGLYPSSNAGLSNAQNLGNLFGRRPIIAANRTGVVYGDPIFQSNGGRFEVRGEANRIYNLLSDSNIQVNARFVPSGTEETNLGDFGVQIRNHRIEYRNGGTVFFNGTQLFAGAEVVLENGETLEWTGRALTITTSEYNIKIKPNRIEIKTGQLGVFQDGVMPHGLFGQTIDLEGRPRNGTGIQGEGAIEGTYRDYEVQDLFSNNFRYNRNVCSAGLGEMPVNSNQILIRYNHRIFLEGQVEQNFLLSNPVSSVNRLFTLFNNQDVQVRTRSESPLARIKPPRTRNESPRTRVKPPRTRVEALPTRRTNVNYSRRRSVIEYRATSEVLINSGRIATNTSGIVEIEEIIQGDGSIETIRRNK